MLGGADVTVDWELVMATGAVTMSLPVLIIILMQGWLIKGLSEVEK